MKMPSEGPLRYNEAAQEHTEVRNSLIRNKTAKCLCRDTVPINH